MVTSVSSSFAPVQFANCDWISDLCKKVYDFAMTIFQSISSFFSGNNPVTTLASTTTTQVPAGNPLNLVAFYRGNEANNNGVSLDEILGWDDGRLEAMHNYIQWLFPLTTPSGPNPTAAVLDQPTIQTFRGDPALKNQMLRSLKRMLSFYGLQMDDATKVITRAPNFAARSAVWLTPSNHNFLRITRIMHSLHLLGLHDYSESVLRIMSHIYFNEGRGIISLQTFNFWRTACPATIISVRVS